MMTPKKLFYGRIFGSVSGCPHEFEQVSSDILRKCAGIPLAINAVASLLANNLGIKKMHALLNSIGHGLTEDRNVKEVEMILSFSYYDLPSHLKTCLLYLTTFPVTHTFEKDRLVKKLIAEGIVTQDSKLTGSSNKMKAKLSQELSLKEAASQHLEELANRNVIHRLECNNNGEAL